MKIKKIAFTVLTFLSINTFSQTEKGNFFIGFDSNSLFNSTSSHLERDDSDEELELGKNTRFSISTRTGYFVSNNLLLGLKVNLNLFKFTNSDNIISKSSQFFVGPNLRYYFLNSNIRPFLNSSYVFQSFKSEFQDQNNNSSDNESNQQTFEVGGGIAFLLNQNIAIELALNYGRTSSDQSNDFQDFKITRIDNQFLASIGFAIFL